MIVFASLVVWLVGFHSWLDKTFTVPLQAPISLSASGKVDRTIRTLIDAPHHLQIEFSIGPRSREEAMRLVGSRPSCRTPKLDELCGVGVPLRWALSDASGRVVASGDGETYGSNSFAATEIWRSVTPSIRVPVGDYRFTASIPRDLPEFEGMAARLSLAVSGGGKVSHGWRSDLAFFGGIANFVVVYPLTGVLGMILIGQGLVYWSRQRRSAET